MYYICGSSYIEFRVKSRKTPFLSFYCSPNRLTLKWKQLFGFSSSTQPCRPLLPAACLWLQRSSWLRSRLSLPRSTRVRGAWQQQCNCYTTVPPGELAWFGDDNKPCEQSSLHYSSKTQGSAESALTLASILAGSHAFPRAGGQALTHS